MGGSKRSLSSNLAALEQKPPNENKKANIETVPVSGKDNNNNVQENGSVNIKVIPSNVSATSSKEKGRKSSIMMNPLAKAQSIAVRI